MFKFLKEKLKGWFKTAEKKVKEAEQKKPEEKVEVEAAVEKEKAEKKVEKKEEAKKPVEEKEIKEAEEKQEEKIEKESKEKKSFFEKIGIVKKYRISEEYFEEIFSQLELLLLENNTALEVVDYLRESLRKELVNTETDKNKVEETIKQALRISLESLFTPSFNVIEKIKNKDSTFVIIFFGINGSGKTTTMAKLAHLLQKNKISCVFAASDTFRAASIEQLKKHGEKLGIKVIHQNYGADPTAVAYDAIEYAKAHKIKAVLIDTAGRMHTKASLIKEMEKIIRVTKPDLKLFIGEAITGNDATEQARVFNEAINIDGIILTKADVDEKGGTSISVSKVTNKPILFLGTGQNYEDLKEFDEKELLKELGL